MLFLLSPTKTLTYGEDGERLKQLGTFTAPAMLASTRLLMDVLKTKSQADIKALMKLSSSLAALNYDRYQAWKPQDATAKPDDVTLKQAAFAFDGPAFRGLDIRSLDTNAIDYLQERLRILSGLYGMLRPLDVIQPYRLEMGTKLGVEVTSTKTLYDFWETQSLTAHLLKTAPRDENGRLIVVNVASNEYSKVVNRDALTSAGAAAGGVVWVDCVFKHDGRIISTYAKRARGLMVRHAGTCQAVSLDDIRAFNLEGYRYNAAQSSEHVLVFTRTNAQYQQALREAEANKTGGATKTKAKGNGDGRNGKKKGKKNDTNDKEDGDGEEEKEEMVSTVGRKAPAKQSKATRRGKGAANRSSDNDDDDDDDGTAATKKARRGTGGGETKQPSAGVRRSARLRK
ncbi:hypothetical protein PTSG_12829 [Salpingoeca rosetta]|uniref:Uncharacterized protein n=1 Tax=Salpingoeca rosetta (strain ATCC 50818 / BSB-021) TaxID=946362 RepID=F2UM30_SALR5|nr:uncharacterized protein PTSG_12829 [Salpingoeca rosetta]EGD78179.1 hypothetical protein PTSG_12829 [Salpingoeca rosetta]|eukprot:XP_004989855.1 hypothetical protein PTSG_12829 [Salpingoeca rosetta]